MRFRIRLDALDEKTMPVPGTDIGRALAEANPRDGKKQPAQARGAVDRRRRSGKWRLDNRANTWRQMAW